jgi:DNA polymerase delta subunit 1
MQVLAHVTSFNDGSVTFYGRTKEGHAVRTVVPNFRTVWVRNAWLPGVKHAHTRGVQGRGLLAADTTSCFTEYWIRGRAPRKDAAEEGWYNRRLGKVEAFYARESVPPLTWFTGTSFRRDDEMARAADREDSSWAPFRLMVFDMECLPKADGGFPQAEADPIIQVSVVMDYDLLQATAASCHLFTWRPTAACLPMIDEYDPRGCEVHVARSETHMLQELVHFVGREDPCLVTGWNIAGFDLPYLLTRCAVLHVDTGALAREGVPRRRDRGDVQLPGRVVADLLTLWRAQHNERSYKLADVSETHLGATKAPVHYSDMRRLWDDAQGRAEMATYCLKDSWLVWRLGATRNVWMNAMQMAKVTFVPLDRIINGGQQIRVFTLLAHYTAKLNVFVPDKVPLCDAGYTGAVVLDPLPGLYRDCVVTLDFASLYPSIMLAFNMCYTTQRTEVTAWELARSLGVPECVAALMMQYTTVPAAAIPADARTYHRCGATDFRREPRGILPTILDTLLGRRKQAKREMAAAAPGLPKAIANGQQLALKLVANSIYGFTGAAEVGMLPQPQIAAAVTCMGRKLTLGTKALCEKEEGVTCVYGDTDSVFLHLEGVTDVAEASARAEQLAAMVDALIPKPNRLEFEKVYRPLLLKGKKRYCGRKYGEGQGDGEMDTKGLEMVRRDNFPLLPDTQRRAMEQLVMHDDPAGADHVTREVLTAILTQVPTDLAPFTIAKELTKAPEAYAVHPPHVKVARRMNPVPAVRERVPYVVTRGRGGVGDRAVHPDEFRAGGYELDTEWYAQQLSNAMRRLLVLSSADVDAVFAPVAGAVMATGSSGILAALGAPADLVWRKSERAVLRPAKRMRQMDMRGFF